MSVIEDKDWYWNVKHLDCYIEATKTPQATSKARAAGISVPDILKAADCSSVSTFKRFYHRPVHSSEFGQVVLGSMQPIVTQKSVSYK